jgi:hypothetical protein
MSNEKIGKTSWELRKLGESTQRSYAQKLKFLAKRSNLDDPLKTAKYILALDNTSKYKYTLLSGYRWYCKANEIY